MSQTKPAVQIGPERDRGKWGRWTVVAVLGIFTELLTDILRDFAADLHNPNLQFNAEAFLVVALFVVMMLVPIYLISRSSESLVDRKTERIIFLISLLVSAFFLPPLSWFAKLASGH